MYNTEKTKCDNCNSQLYDGGFRKIGEKNPILCESACVREYMELREIEERQYKRIKHEKHTCSFCGELLNPDFEIYTDCNGELFCSDDCFLNQFEFIG